MAKFQKGHPKPANSGRQKGVPNKARLKKVAEVLAEKGINPAAEIVLEIAQMEEPRDRAKAWADLLAYCEAKPKAQEEPPRELDPAEFAHIASDDLLKLVKPDGAT